MKILITTVPFGTENKLPIELLDNLNAEYIINPLNKKLTEGELLKMTSDVDIIIAGTEPITKKVINSAKKLKMISRVGIGLDSVDLITAKAKGIKVCYTPDAPAPAVAELTLGVMLSLLRSLHVSNSQLHNGEWKRIFGHRLAEITIGVIGVGRIGGRVLRRTQAFGTPRLLVNDIVPDFSSNKNLKLDWVSKEQIFQEADIVSLHVPLTKLTKNMVSRKTLLGMKKDAMIINVSRGGIINEQDLYEVMKSGHLAGAAIDVFENEPYQGKLREIERCFLTAHMGSMSVDCRSKMEIEATEEVIRFIKKRELINEVPQLEYDIQMDGL